MDLFDIPSTVKYLKLSNFDKVISKCQYKLPENLYSLDMCKFNKKFTKTCLPKKLVNLELYFFYNEWIKPGCLPDNIKSIRITNMELTPGLLPKNLEIVNILCDYIKINSIPENIKRINFELSVKNIEKNSIPLK